MHEKGRRKSNRIKQQARQKRLHFWRHFSQKGACGILNTSTNPSLLSSLRAFFFARFSPTCVLIHGLVNGSRIDRTNSLTRLVSVMFFLKQEIQNRGDPINSLASVLPFYALTGHNFLVFVLLGRHESCIRRKETREVCHIVSPSSHDSNCRGRTSTLLRSKNRM